MNTKRMTSRQVSAWLDPIRSAFRELLTGECSSVRGYAITRINQDDSYARTDYCIAGFRGLIERLFPDISTEPLLRVEKRLANGVLMTVADVEAALSFLRTIEKPMMRLRVCDVTSAVLTEQVAIECEALGLAA